MMKRRKFLRNTMSFAALLALHNEAQAFGILSQVNKDLNASRFKEITLYTSELKAQFEFYSNVLEFPIISKDQSQFTMGIGKSKLIFKEITDGSAPFYHFAINIPTNKHLKAQNWLAKRTSLLMDEGSDQGLLYFDFWDAHAMYFKDPSGNIGELIARHTLDNQREGEFGIEDLLYISEIGTPVAEPLDFAKELKLAYDLNTFGSSMFVGDEYGLFVAAPVDRLWFPEYTQKAAVFPTEICISDKKTKEMKYQDYPYKIKSNMT